MCVKLYYFNTKYMVKETISSNRFISLVEMLNFQINKVKHINVCI